MRYSVFVSLRDFALSEPYIIILQGDSTSPLLVTTITGVQLLSIEAATLFNLDSPSTAR